MPNPYHDELGLFASKDAMGKAVVDLEQQVLHATNDHDRSVAMGKWFELKRSYDDIVAGKVSMPTEWVSRVANSGLTATPHDAEAQRVFYAQIKDKLQDPEEPGNDSATHRAIALLREKNLPKDIREAILRDSAPKVQANILREVNKSDFEATSTDLLLATKGPGVRLEPVVAEQLMASRKLTFEQKFDVAQQGYATTSLVSINPQLSTQNPETEQAVLDNMILEGEMNRTPGASYYAESNTYGRAWSELAERGGNEETHQTVFRRFYNDPISTDPDARHHPYVSLLKNPKISDKMATDLLAHIAQDDPAAFRDAAATYRSVDARRGNKINNALYDGLFAMSGLGVDDKVYQPYNADAIWYFEQEATVAANKHRAPVAQAHLDGPPAKRKELIREFKKAYGRNKAVAKTNPQAKALLDRIELAEAAYNAKKTMDYLAAGPRP